MKKLQRAILMIITIALISCGGSDGPTGPENPHSPEESEPTTGAIEVTTNTTGDDIDSDGYTVATANVSSSIDPNGSTVLPDLSEGSAEVELSGIASNCSVSGENPRDVSVTAEDTTTTTFDIECEAQLKNEILFQSDRDADPYMYELFVMDEDGNNVRQLTNNGIFYIGDISSDGTKILYTNFPKDGLFRMNADGSEQKKLISDADIGLGSWSPDESQIFFGSGRDGDFELYIADADGSNIEQITDNTYGDDYPDWSPDGDKIVFRSRPDDAFNLYTINSDGTGLTQLTSATKNVGGARWSHDGQKLVFSRDGDIYTINADGSDEQLVYDGSRNLFNPSWSADDSKIIYDRNMSQGGYEIYFINADGSGQPTNITNSSSSNDQFPTWSPIE
ncbi:TolB family protein [Fodinibius sp. AD559]|uniref:TolB family protein n=1 Tax=Fodinibius sp. AD559 TaxID=3424179 RepID=UPI004046CE42